MASLVKSRLGVTLVGGGEVVENTVQQALALAPTLVAADGGGNILADLGHLPVAVIGDMDSLRPDLVQLWADRLHPISEQDSTDFDKCLRSIDAPFVLAVGFDGARLDHTLSAMSALVRHGRARVVLVGGQDICFLAPPQIALELGAGARVSLYPMGPVTGRSTGLEWPIDGIDFAPNGVIGTSNRASAAQVGLEIDAPRMLLLLERAALPMALRALLAAPDWE
jgi:thiamine pyrophosphokinase